jgi:hypothetical protein
VLRRLEIGADLVTGGHLDCSDFHQPRG